MTTGWAAPAALRFLRPHLLCLRVKLFSLRSLKHVQQRSGDGGAAAASWPACQVWARDGGEGEALLTI